MTGRIPVDGALATPLHVGPGDIITAQIDAGGVTVQVRSPADVLREISALVKLLSSERPELWCAVPVDVAATLPGAQVTVQPRQGEPGKVLHVVRATVDGLLVVALETRDAAPEDTPPG